MTAALNLLSTNRPPPRRIQSPPTQLSHPSSAITPPVHRRVKSGPRRLYQGLPQPTTWICTNLAPQGPPFIDQRTQSEGYDRLTVQPDSPRCPPITFLGIRRHSPPIPAHRLRSLLNLGPTSAETIYLSVPRENDSQPLPIHVSLLWLSRAANSGTALEGNQQQRR